MNLTSIAQSYLQSGLSVLPANPGEKRPSLAHWKKFQSQLPKTEQVDDWFQGASGLCIVTGQVSGNLEMLDFDGEGELFPAWYQAVDSQDPALLDRLVVERSQSNGLHIIYRCESPVCGNLKLAQRLSPVPSADPVVISGKIDVPRQIGNNLAVLQTLIETRGEKGLFLATPTPGYELQQGQFDQLPVLTVEERDLLLRVAWELNEYVPEPEERSDFSSTDPEGHRPGDDFNKRGDIQSLLKKHGWQIVRGGVNEYWRRPGKTDGWSATLKDRVFYVFSSNAAPFEPERAYSPFGVLALLEHSGDFEQAASALANEGYGNDENTAGGVDLSHLLKNRKNCNDSISTSLIVMRVSDVRREKLQWLWPARIPLGKLTLLAGDPGLGKSMVTIDLAARVSRGGCWPDNALLKQPTGSIIMFNAEDDLADTIAPRLDAADADTRQILVIEGVEAKSDKERIQRTFTLEAEPDAEHIREILLANDKTVEDLQDDVKLLIERRELRKQYDALPELRQRKAENEQKIAEVDQELEVAKQRHNERTAPFYNRLYDINRAIKLGLEAERQLFETCNDQELLTELEQLGEEEHREHERQRKLDGEIRELRRDAESCRQESSRTNLRSRQNELLAEAKSLDVQHRKLERELKKVQKRSAELEDSRKELMERMREV